MLILIQLSFRAERGLSSVALLAGWVLASKPAVQADWSSPVTTQHAVLLSSAQFSDFLSPVLFTLFSAPWKPEDQVNMSKIFNWEYFSFVTLDDAVAYKVGGDVN